MRQGAPHLLQALTGKVASLVHLPDVFRMLILSMVYASGKEVIRMSY